MGNRTVRGWLLAAAGVVALVATAVMGFLDRASPTPRYSFALLIVLALAGIVMLATGLEALREAKQEAAGSPEEPADYRHAWPVFGLLGVGLLVALTARSLAVPSDFGEFGYYRGGAPSDAMVARQPRYQGREVCRKCHDYQFGLNDKDVHHTVQCEDCHGPGDLHAAQGKRGNIVVPKTKDLCLICHRQITARPGPFPQITWEEHYKFVGARDTKVECLSCHDPHEPLFLDTPVKEARLHPLIQRCRDCHLGRIDEKLQRPANHPATFECAYCHKQIAADFQTAPHKALQCTACHQFQRESDFAGRIVKNKDPRFCLLCHGSNDLRHPGDAGTPIIDWPAHITQKDPSKEADDGMSCTECHLKQLHPSLGGSAHE